MARRRYKNTGAVLRVLCTAQWKKKGLLKILQRIIPGIVGKDIYTAGEPLSSFKRTLIDVKAVLLGGACPGGCIE